MLEKDFVSTACSESAIKRPLADARVSSTSEDFMKTFVIVIFLIGLSAPVLAESVTVFKGHPAIKISEGGIERTIEEVPKDKAPNLVCVISKIGGKYYWASRDNLELVSTQSGAFTTFVATNGSGYVRVLKPEMKQAASLAGGPESRYDYVEHLLLGLRSVTYYGTRSK